MSCVSGEAERSLVVLAERRDWLTARIAAKQSVGWDVEWDVRERDALAWAVAYLSIERTNVQEPGEQPRSSRGEDTVQATEREVDGRPPLSPAEALRAAVAGTREMVRRYPFLRTRTSAPVCQGCVDQRLLHTCGAWNDRG